MIKFFPIFSLLQFLFLFAYSQQKPNFSTYYYQRLSHFKTLPDTREEIIFLGNSITDGAEWSELFGDARIRNRGISGDITAGVLYRLDEVTSRKPAKIFLLIGTNDLARNMHPDSVAKNIFLMASQVHAASPATDLFVQNILPVNDEFGKFGSHTNKTKQILRVNQLLKDSAGYHYYTLIDLYAPFSSADGKLDSAYTNDGLHLKGDGYLLWQQIIYPYVFDAEPHPALIPLPQQVKWAPTFFSLYQCNGIVLKDTSLKSEAKHLQKMLLQKGWDVPVLTHAAEGKVIAIQLGKVSAPHYQEEAYRIEGNPSKVLITANTAHGVFNALQTLGQLMRNGTNIPSCTIIDWPAFQWRGYMIDVGRNFMPMDLLKQQIAVMARYKLNIFHLHLTEDIAWRLALKQYPQLTDAATMIRNKGRFYSEQDIKELIAFCKERYITLVPEIDMPGHSAAFRRAMKTDMQSDSGLTIVKNILKEVFETYDFPYIHIGADEVKITNKDFLPEIIAFINKYDKRIIGWEPGGNFTDEVIRQLWMDDAAHLSKDTKIQLIDSRHLYLNHMDPLEAVTTIFFRKIGDKKKGDASLLGATLCMWPDRKVEVPLDVFRMNALYPGMVTFAERVWRGGGEDGWTAVIGAPGSERAKKFAAFEDRLLDHKHQYFSQVPFPYTRQYSTTWTLYGPYDIGGDFNKKFEPEKNGFDTTHLEALKRVVGGTIVLRHWWYPLIDGVIKDPEENTTIYATTQIWSDADGWKNFWIGFNDISRSPATDSPPLDEWDEDESTVWVNGILIAPPHWRRAGMKGNSEIPLIDEGYTYREPTRIFLHKGWNTVWVKAPVGSFKGKDWQNPVKWIFTFVEKEN